MSSSFNLPSPFGRDGITVNRLVHGNDRGDGFSLGDFCLTLVAQRERKRIHIKEHVVDVTRSSGREVDGIHSFPVCR